MTAITGRCERLAPRVRLPSWPGESTPQRRAGDTTALVTYPAIDPRTLQRLLAGGVQIRWLDGAAQSLQQTDSLSQLNDALRVSEEGDAQPARDEDDRRPEGSGLFERNPRPARAD